MSQGQAQLPTTRSMMSDGIGIAKWVLTLSRLKRRTSADTQSIAYRIK